MKRYKDAFVGIIVYLIAIFIYHIIFNDKDVNYTLVIITLLAFLIPPLLKRFKR